jgi:hypothetical protein
MPQNDNAHLDDDHEIHLTNDELDHAHRAVDDLRAITSEHITRFAKPNERSVIAERIVPTTATVFFRYADASDPYGEHNLPDEARCVGREFFVVDPADGIAIWIGDLPHEKQHLLRDKKDRANAEGWRRLLSATPSSKKI